MIDLFIGGGVMMWPILLCTLLVVGLAVRAAVGGAQRNPIGARSDQSVVLFWGVTAAILGVLGTLVGVMQIASAVEGAGAVQAATLWSGIKVALITSIAGTCTLMLALLSWMTLRFLRPAGGGGPEV